ncbi:MAG: zf-TFIIB domain-containing protein [Deltaproteobacteria bacterium]|nr:zf-TFIIB domain-containing protein [Deltaproteobacteria bacterium]
MDCPQCNVEMEELSGDDLTLQRCGNCEGLWTDVAELNRILLHNNLPGLESMGGRPNNDELSRQCPNDQCDMIVVEGGPKHSLRFETCEVCSGIWLEPEGEVNNAKDAIGEFIGFFKRFRNHAA